MFPPGDGTSSADQDVTFIRRIGSCAAKGLCCILAQQVVGMDAVACLGVQSADSLHWCIKQQHLATHTCMVRVMSLGPARAHRLLLGQRCIGGDLSVPGKDQWWSVWNMNSANVNLRASTFWHPWAGV